MGNIVMLMHYSTAVYSLFILRYYDVGKVMHFTSNLENECVKQNVFLQSHVEGASIDRSIVCIMVFGDTSVLGIRGVQVDCHPVRSAEATFRPKR